MYNLFNTLHRPLQQEAQHTRRITHAVALLNTHVVIPRLFHTGHGLLA